MTMGILNIAPAERAGAHLLFQLYGPTLPRELARVLEPVHLAAIAVHRTVYRHELQRTIGRNRDLRAKDLRHDGVSAIDDHHRGCRAQCILAGRHSLKCCGSPYLAVL